MLTGEFLGTSRFEVVRRLGAGGMGIVYEAFDRERQQRVALKTLRAFSSHAIMRMKREFRALADLDHPNLVRLLELVQDGHQWFFTMELVEGTDFATWVRGTGERTTSTQPTAPALAATEVDATVPAAPSGGDTISAPPLPGVPQTLDEGRLRDALPQLVRAVDALHRAGKIHRDLKPSNVRVTPEGRVVLLDFGLVYELEEDHTEDHPVGTVLYMAPEQGGGQTVTPAADWYALGVMLFEALTGQLPFNGGWRDVIAAKQQLAPALPQQLADGVPEDLAELALQLLAREATARPAAPEILARLGDAPPAAAPASARAPFVGRRRELELLSAAWSEAQGGQGGMVLVHGESGVGKSALVRRMAEELRQRVDGLLVLSGRYYEREMVPFRAFDAIVDSLVRYLLTVSSERAAAVLPTDIELLVDAFPVLRDVDHTRVSAAKELAALDAHTRRRRMFAAARELFGRLGRRLPTLVIIDDVQWADADSRALFGEIMAAPAPPLLVVCTMRTTLADTTQLERAVKWLGSFGRVRRLALGGLEAADAEHLCRELLGGTDDARLARILAEGAGHPLFLEVLCGADASASGETRLDDALLARAAHLGEAARRVLSLCALAGTTLPEETLRLAAGLSFDELARATAALGGAHLLRTTRQGNTERVEPFHDRVAESVLRALPAAERVALHQRLATALERARGASTQHDAELLYRQWKGAQDADRAAFYADQAAAEATRVLGFDRAAALYGEALELTTAPPARQQLLVKLGEALAMAGRGRAAADAFLSATTSGERLARDDEAELRRRAGEQLLRSGHIDEAMVVLKQVLASVDFSTPPSASSSLWWFLARRAQIRLRGLGYLERRADEVPAAELRRIDVCWSVASSLGLVDTIAGAYFQARYLLAALRAGEPSRVARALSTEVCYSSADGVPAAAYTATMLARATALATRVGDPALVGWTHGTGGIAATLEGRFADALRLCEEADAMLRNSAGVAWELHTITFFRVWSLAYCGRLDELARMVPASLKQAEERGDLYGAAILRMGLAILRHLAADDAEAARAGVRQAMSMWSHNGFFVEHWWEHYAETMIDLYNGEARSALGRVRARWPDMRRAVMLRVQLTNMEARFLRARALLAVGAIDPAERPALLDAARADARVMKKSGMRWAMAASGLIEGAAYALAGETARAAACFGVAGDALEPQQVRLLAAVARWARGALLGEEGRALAASAEEWMRSAGVRAPERMVRLFLGFVPALR